MKKSCLHTTPEQEANSTATRATSVTIDIRRDKFRSRSPDVLRTGRRLPLANHGTSGRTVADRMAFASQVRLRRRCGCDQLHLQGK